MTPTPDSAVDLIVLDPVHMAVVVKDLLPTRHLVETAYIDAEGIIASVRDHSAALSSRVRVYLVASVHRGRVHHEELPA